MHDTFKKQLTFLTSKAFNEKVRVKGDGPRFSSVTIKTLFKSINPFPLYYNVLVYGKVMCSDHAVPTLFKQWGVVHG